MQATTSPPGMAVDSADERVERLDWAHISADLEQQGSVVIEKLLSAGECRDISALYGRDESFRSTIVMARHGFGRGEYKYFAYPLPDLIAGLRGALYAQLSPVANACPSGLSPTTEGKVASLGRIGIFPALREGETREVKIPILAGSLDDELVKSVRITLVSPLQGRNAGDNVLDISSAVLSD